MVQFHSYCQYLLLLLEGEIVLQEIAQQRQHLNKLLGGACSCVNLVKLSQQMPLPYFRNQCIFVDGSLGSFPQPPHTILLDPLLPPQYLLPALSEVTLLLQAI